MTRQYTDDLISSTKDVSWGYCSLQCKGQKAEPNSTFNLGSRNYRRKIWQSNFYDLRAFGAGYCHTYNPPQASPTDYQSRFFLLLGKREAYIPRGNLINFEVYLHEKGQFWPSWDLPLTGQSERITIKSLEEIVGHFSVTKVSSINKSSKPCTDVLNYSFTECIIAFINKQMNCTISWSANEETNCDANMNLTKYQKHLLKIQFRSSRIITKMTGCLPKCKITTYRFTEQTREKVDWNSNWMSSFYVMPKTGTINHKKEVYKVGVSELLADIGSYLGLFLGWSVLSILKDLGSWCKLMLRVVTRRLNSEEPKHM